ncbi:MAG: helix-turn-helix domain-containing protein, partial [Planctomycetia bacterium]|nr:helix-turn-helix domain-containing protein [Planctomycetia bacterium]
MAKKFFDIDEAAAMLGITPAALNDMRTRNEIRGFRDGTTWKFRSEELEKVSAELKSKPKSSGPAPDESGIGLADEGPGEGGSVLLSERELGSGPTTSSTIIGKSSASKSSSDSDIQLSEPSRDPKTATSDVKLASTSGVLSEGPGPGSELGLQFEELDSLELDFDDSGKGMKPAASDSAIAGSAISASAEKPITAPIQAGDSNLSLGEEIAPP